MAAESPAQHASGADGEEIVLMVGDSVKLSKIGCEVEDTNYDWSEDALAPGDVGTVTVAGKAPKVKGPSGREDEYELQFLVKVVSTAQEVPSAKEPSTELAACTSGTVASAAQEEPSAKEPSTELAACSSGTVASGEQPKRAPCAYWLFLGENRDAVATTLGTKRPPEIAKKISEMWKALSDDERKPYEDKAAKLKAEYEEAIKAFKEGGGVIAKKARKNTEEDTKAKKEAKKDPNAPKKPVGGGYGVYLAENRLEIVKSLPSDHKITDVAKAAGVKWKALTDEERKVYEIKYAAKVEDYKKANAEYVASHPQEQHVASPPPKAATKKRSAEDSAAKPPRAKKGREATNGNSKDAGDAIDATVLAEAKKLNMDAALKNLACRNEIVALKLPAEKMLSALKAANGLVNPAKHALLGA